MAFRDSTQQSGRTRLPRLSRFHRHLTHPTSPDRALITSVRPTQRPNPFVAASSEVYLWGVLWRPCAVQARTK